MKLDNYQIKAVNAKERNILVVAAPGSGKTTVIINRIKHFVENLSIKVNEVNQPDEASFTYHKEKNGEKRRYCS